MGANAARRISAQAFLRRRHAYNDGRRSRVGDDQAKAARHYCRRRQIESAFGRGSRDEAVRGGLSRGAAHGDEVSQDARDPVLAAAQGVDGVIIVNAIKGKYRNGQIILAQKADWPEDTEVLVEPVASGPTIGMRDEDWPDSPEAIAEWIRWVDSLQPVMTEEEDAAWRAALKEQREYDKSKFEERSRRIERLFE